MTDYPETIRMETPLKLLASCTGTLTARILAFAAMLFLVVLTASLIHAYIAQEDLAEEFAASHVGGLADTYFDGLNKLMLTGGMASRDEVGEQIKALPNVIEARVIRADGVSGQYGEGDSKERAVDDIDRAALKGEEVARIEKTEQGRRLTLARPYRASEKTRGVNCMGCHTVADGTVLGVVRVSYDLAPVDARIFNASLVSLGIHAVL